MGNWDNEIDEAARQMTVGEPDPGFKARVLARIEGETGPRRGWSLWVWPAVALTAAAVLAAVLVRLPSRSEGVSTDTTVRLKPDTTYDRVGSSSAAAGRSEASGASVTSGAGGASGVSRTETGQKNEAMARADGMESLVPSPIEIDPLGLESMEAMESIQVPTLAIARIEVAAIAEE